MSDPVNVVAIGEVLWDLFPGEERLGGAPANFAIHVAQIARAGAAVTLASAIGDDELGAQTLRLMGDTAVCTDLVSVVDKPTGRVNVQLDAQKTPSYNIAVDVAWDAIEWSDALASLAPQADVVCFGTLAQRSAVSRATIDRFVANTGDACWRILDVNLRPTMDDQAVITRSLELANVLKISDEELPVLALQFGLEGEATAQLKQLKKQFGLKVVAFTRGGDGAIVITDDRDVSCDGFPVEVVDTVGAGDSFTAAFAWGLAQRRPVQEVVENACRVAALVCSQQGATPKIPESLLG